MLESNLFSNLCKAAIAVALWVAVFNGWGGW